MWPTGSFVVSFGWFETAIFYLNIWFWRFLTKGLSTELKQNQKCWRHNFDSWARVTTLHPRRETGSSVLVMSWSHTVLKSRGGNRVSPRREHWKREKCCWKNSPVTRCNFMGRASSLVSSPILQRKSFDTIDHSVLVTTMANILKNTHDQPWESPPRLGPITISNGNERSQSSRLWSACRAVSDNDSGESPGCTLQVPICS